MAENESTDTGSVEICEDDWHSVTDAKKRKQIQDRLAQRARRKRLQEAKKNAKQAPKARGSELVPCSMDLHAPVSSSSSSSALLPQSPKSFPSCIPAPSMSFELQYPPTVFGAAFINGQILGLKCGTVVPAKSLPASSAVPLPLHPTPTQLLTVHPIWIDRLPFPKARDNFINMIGFIDEEEFLRDFFTIPSFSIAPGTASWDPRGWKIEKPFADKWGFLFF